ncbi:O-antigen ligase family protein [Arthrobacter sp. NPDC089319]|uniref:O-antigen ligase family protein n=1 Tax=Arthrobacter sp. NPDC089319 TaxID=3155915 RepID=UPI003424ECBF
MKVTMARRDRTRQTLAERNWRLTARIIIVAALLLEVQGPRFGADLRFNVAIFAALAYFLLLHRIRSVIRNLHVTFKWPVIALFGYCIWALGSAGWSAIPGESMLQAGLLFLALVLAVSYADIPPLHMAREYARVATLVAGASWLMLLLTPSLAVVPDVTWRLNGVMGHEQRLALVVGAGIIVWVSLRVAGHQVFTNTARDNLALILLIVTLLATQTRANTVFVAIVVGAVLYARVHAAFKVVLIIGVIGLVAWVTINFTSIMSLLDREGSNLETLTGRTSIWQGALGMIPDRFWQGYGFGSFFSPLTAHFFSSYVAPHAHNTWINAAFETGVIGAVLLSLFLLGGLFAGRANRSNRYAWPVVLFVMLCGTMGVVFGGKLSTLWVIVTVMVAQAAWSAKAPRTVPEADSRDLLTARTGTSLQGSRRGNQERRRTGRGN